MPPRILIVPDKFKGTLTTHAAAKAIAAGWRKARPADRLATLPMSDGGDGFGEVLGELTNSRQESTSTVDAAHRPLRARWWWDEGGRVAVVDSVEIIGLAMMQRGKFHPFQLDTYGLGAVLKAAANAGATRVIAGIGGSATNDGGFGLARALGWKFLDQKKDEVAEWWQLRELSNIKSPARRLDFKVTVAVDVANPLLGPQGCSRIYGPQKGLRSQDFDLAEKCLGRMASVLKEQHRIDCAKTSGAGAAGGLGFGFMAFTGAQAESGFELFARCAKLDQRIKESDLVITGEGRMDNQTYMGKGVGEIARRCRKFGVPCLALAGSILEPERAGKLFTQVRSLAEVAEPSRAKSEAASHLKKLAQQMAEALPMRLVPR